MQRWEIAPHIFIEINDEKPAQKVGKERAFQVLRLHKATTHMADSPNARKPTSEGSSH